MSQKEEEIYIAQWEGCEIKGQENKICKLLESLHDFKQTTDNGMGNLIRFWLVMDFHPLMLINVCKKTLDDKCIHDIFACGWCAHFFVHV